MPRTPPTRPPPTAARPPRRTHAQRSGETRQKLCDAALQLLCELGYERVTTALIAQRAAVSKGAQTHHFPTKADVLAAAFEHLLSQWKLRRIEFLERHGGTASLEQTLRYLWRQVFHRPDYVAAIEMMLAARHDEPLRERLEALLATWVVDRDDMFRRAAGLDGDLKKTSTFLQLNFSVLRGMAIYDSLATDKADHLAVLDLWIAMARRHLEDGATAAVAGQAHATQPSAAGRTPTSAPRAARSKA